MAHYRKITVEGDRVLILSAEPSAMIVAMKASLIPVGLGFRRAGNGWGVLDLVRWGALDPALAAGPDSEPSSLP